MSKWLVCTATPTSGVRHRLMMLSAVKHFADTRGYSVFLLWGVSGGVSYCRFEELLAPIPGVRVVNLPAAQINPVVACARTQKTITIGKHALRVFRGGEPPRGNFFSWDLVGAWALAKAVPGRPDQLVARPAQGIRAEAADYSRTHGLGARLGIRVRVEELPYRDRKPHRVRKELDDVVRSLVRIPWYTRVFVATDSEYIQQMLASHFHDARFLPKSFDLQEPTGRYVHRQDKHAMFTFLKEVDCLCRCKRIINIGGFLNDRSVGHKILREPYSEAAYLHVARR